METIKKYKKLYLVDNNDKVIKAANWEEIYNKKNKFFTRVIHVWIFYKNKMLIQKRSNNLRLYPGFYESSASGHVDFGESYSRAALRELKEELGIKTKIYPIMKLKVKRLKNMCMLFIGFIGENDKKKIRINKEEIQSIKFCTIKEIKKLIKNKRFTPSFEELFKRFFNKKKNFCFKKTNKKVLEELNKILN
ncbi:MAG: NUDIX domain-containing protein [Candidatus Woesearchaeota archaeon]